MHYDRTITETRTFKIKVHCDCGGQFFFNGNALMTHPPMYAHECSDCGITETFSDQYPMDHTQEVGEPQKLPD
jgi:hypothetical protein